MPQMRHRFPYVGADHRKPARSARHQHHTALRDHGIRAGVSRDVMKVLWTCVMQVLRKFRSDSVHVAPLETAGIINVEMIPYCRPMSHGTRGHLAWVQWGPQSGGSSLLVVGSSELVSILLCSLSMSGAALSTRLRGALRLQGSCS